MPGPLAELVRQHAETARLLGVDFVPVFGGGSFEAGGEGGVADACVVPGIEAGAEAVGDSGALFEAKPLTPRGAGAVGATAGMTQAERMAELRARYERDAPHAGFVTSFTNIVWGDGDVNASLMFVGEAPGADEDRTGVPFVGKAGQLLNKMISAMGLRREEVYIANVLKTRPPNNATPTLEESSACAPYLFEQISIVAPSAIVALGLPASRVLLSTSEAMNRLRGRWHAFEDRFTGRSIPVMPTYHPAYLLRSYTPENRNMVWSDLQQVMRLLGLSAGR